MNEGSVATRPALLLGVGVTPTKPLVPTHLKGLVWMETALRATRLLRPVEYIGNSGRPLWDSSIQTLRFWAHLDRTPESCTREFYRDKDEIWVGRRYVEHSQSAEAVAADVLDALRRRVDEQGWTHESARRVLEIWDEQYATMGIHAPRTECQVRLSLSLEEALARLRDLDCLLDLRSAGGAVYLDLTAQGVPLRVLIDPHGRQNYLVPLLRLLLGSGAGYERVIALYDLPTDQDFVLIASALAQAGIRVERLGMARVALPDVEQTTRAGGWEGYTCGDLCSRYLARFEPEVFRLGLRIYFILYLPFRTKACFSHDEMERAMKKAEQVLRRSEAADVSAEELAAIASRFTSNFYERTGLVDPHALLSFLLTKESLERHGGALRALCT